MANSSSLGRQGAKTMAAADVDNRELKDSVQLLLEELVQQRPAMQTPQRDRPPPRRCMRRTPLRW